MTMITGVKQVKSDDVSGVFDSDELVDPPEA